MHRWREAIQFARSREAHHALRHATPLPNARPPTVVPVNVDRPLFFFIGDLATDTILFVGREDDPTAE